MDPEKLRDLQQIHVPKINVPYPLPPGRVVADGGGLRKNEGKPPLELVPPEAIWAIARVLRHGAEKYAARNWERGMNWTICYACAMRHLLKWMEGQPVDEESGLSHLDHALTNLAFLVAYERRQAGTDDRPVYVKT